MRRGWRLINVRATGPARPAKTEGGDLDKALSAVNAAAAQGRVMWLSLLAFGTYLFVVVGGTTHRDLLLEGPVKLPILSTELPLFTFYWAAPVLFILFHLYMLLKLGVIAGKLALFEDGLAATLARIGDPDKRTAEEAGWRGQLDAFLYLQMRASPAGNGVQRALVRATIWVTVVIGPVLLLLAFQIRFLPYHHEVMTWAHRAFVAVDLLLLLVLWPAAAGGRGARRWVPIAAFGVVALPFSLLIATIPGETEDWELQAEHDPPWWPTKVLFEGEWDDIKRTVVSPFSRNLALQDQVLIDRGKLDQVETTLNLRGRDLRYANFAGADLRKADLYGATLQDARLSSAQLRGANLERAQMQGAELEGAQMQDALLWYALLQGGTLEHAQLHGAKLYGAQLQGAILRRAQLPRADLTDAQLQGADLGSADLPGVDLYEAKLPGANLAFARLPGANLSRAQMQGANLAFADLRGARLSRTQLRGANLQEADLRVADLNGTDLQGADLRGSSIWRTYARSADLTLANLRDLNLEPMTPNEIEALKSVVGEGIVDDVRREQTLRRFAVLLEPWDDEWEHSWQRAASPQRSEADDEPALAAFLANLACDAKDAPFVARGIVRRIIWHDTDFERAIPFAPLVAKALLDPACAGAAGLNDNEVSNLQRIVDEAAAKP